MSSLPLCPLSGKSVSQPRTVSICKSTHNSAKTYRTGLVFPTACILVSLPVLATLPVLLFALRRFWRWKSQKISRPRQNYDRMCGAWERWNGCRQTLVVHIFTWTARSRGRAPPFLFPIVRYLLSVLSFSRENRRGRRAVGRIVQDVFPIFWNGKVTSP